jgi:hypothetical protein
MLYMAIQVLDGALSSSTCTLTWHANGSPARRKHEYSPWKQTNSSRSLIQEFRDHHRRGWVPPPCPSQPTPRPGESEVNDDDLLNYQWTLAERCEDQEGDWSEWTTDESTLLAECLSVEPDQSVWLELQRAREADHLRVGKKAIEIEYGMHIRSSTKNNYKTYVLDFLR